MSTPQDVTAAAEDPYALVTGTYEEGLAFVGRNSEVMFGDAEVNWSMIKAFCSASEDANPSYWDREFAQEHWGGLIAPPGTLLTWLIPLTWKPKRGAPRRMIVLDVPLPGDTLINVSSETEFLQPMRLGDVLNAVDTVTSISAEKTTRLGTGHFVEDVLTVRNQRGEVVARKTTTAFRFSSVEAA